MVEKITKYKKYIMSIVLISVLTIFFVNINYLLPKKYEELPEVKLKEIVDKDKSFAIMISDNGINYQKYESNSWPNDNYKLTEAKCIDNNGNLVKNAVSFESETITLETDKTVSCTLYFNLNTISPLDLVTNKSYGLSQNLVGNLYRYQGKNNINNYICFGTRKENECKSNPEKYMYRIIGITESGNLKLIKPTYIIENENYTFLWNNSSVEDISWPDSLLFKRINGKSNGDIEGTTGNTNIFVGSKNYPYMSEGNSWYNLILNYIWKYGDGKYAIQNGRLAFLEEEGFQKPIEAKISLMYVSDYLLSCIDQNDDGTKLTEEEFQNTWMYLTEDNPNKTTKYEYTMVRYGWNASVNAYLAIVVGSDPGYHVAMHFLNDNDKGVRPVFYLTKDIKLFGKGTKEEPYLIIT